MSTQCHFRSRFIYAALRMHSVVRHLHDMTFARYTLLVSLKKGTLAKNSLPIGGYETRLHTKLSTETFLAMYESQKYTDICVILPHFERCGNCCN